ncbi:MAG: GtrA family protein [Bacteroidetes bacterium]|nr:GtrA family protein [Bacteroidota bacterium]
MSLPKIITSILDFIYPLVGKFMPRKTYYYAACGSGNLVLSWLLFFFFYQFVFSKKNFPFQLPLNINFVATAYTLSSICCFLISFTIGFLLMKYVVFTGSELKGRVQLFRYALSSTLSGLLSWVILKLFVEVFSFYPSIANVLASCIVVIFGYLMQRNFSFK